MNKKMAKIPELRFPEFKGKWIFKRLDEMANLTSSKRVYLSDYVDEGIPFYRGKEITELKQNLEPENILYISEARFNDFKEKYGAPQKEDILITAVGTLGNVYRIRANYNFYFKDGNLIWLRNINENSIFLEQIIDWKKHELIKVSIGSTQKALTIVELNKVIFAIPIPPEQNKIASFLTAVGKRINLLQKKKAELTQFKKGVMQKLFDVKEDGCPALRFKQDDGSDFPDWEEKKLGDVASFSKGKGISKADIAKDGTTECIRYGELYTVYSEVISKIASKTNIDENELVLSEENDVIIPASGETQIDIATASCVEKSGIALGGDLNIIKSQIDGIFLSYYLNNARKRNIARLAQGISVVHLYASQLAILKIDLPYLREQKKIADFLSSIDKSIENIADKIEQSQKWKQGLLQKMFV